MKYIAILFIILFFVLYFNIKEKFINLDLLIWKKVPASTCKKIAVHEDKIYKKCSPKKEQLLLNKFKFDFMPYFIYDSKNNIISEEYYPIKLNKNNKPIDFIEQLKNIEYTLKKNKIYHNDIKLEHLFLKDNKIKLIDWNNVTFNKPINKSKPGRNWVNNDFDIIIEKLR